MEGISTIGISVSVDTFNPRNYAKAKISTLAINVSVDTFNPRNYAKAKISTLGVSCEKAEESIITYQIN